MASIDGQFKSYDIPTNFSGIEIKFNPFKQLLFVDENNEAIQFAEHVIILGHRAFACGKIIYHSLDTAPKKIGDILSNTIVNQKTKILDIPLSHIQINNKDMDKESNLKLKIN